jgi:CcmD family protein
LAQRMGGRLIDARNFEFMFYGFTVAWLIVFAYVLTLVGRARRIRGELKRLGEILEQPESRPLP